MWGLIQYSSLKILLLLGAVSNVNGQNTQVKIPPPLYFSVDLNEYRNTFKIYKHKAIARTTEDEAAFSEKGNTIYTY